MSNKKPEVEAQELLAAAFPGGIKAEEYERAVALVLKAVGWEPPEPPHQRMAALISGLLRQYGEQSPESLARRAKCSIGSVYNGLRACGAERFERRVPGKTRPVVRWRMPKAAAVSKDRPLGPCPDCGGVGGFTSGATAEGSGEDSECPRCRGYGRGEKTRPRQRAASAHRLVAPECPFQSCAAGRCEYDRV